MRGRRDRGSGVEGGGVNPRPAKRGEGGERSEPGEGPCATTNSPSPDTPSLTLRRVDLSPLKRGEVKKSASAQSHLISNGSFSPSGSGSSNAFSVTDTRP